MNQTYTSSAPSSRAQGGHKRISASKALFFAAGNAGDSWQGEWSSLFALIPEAFNVMPPGTMAREGFELISNAAHTRRFVSVVTDTQANLRTAGVPIIVKEYRGARPILAAANLKRARRRWLGQLALELYFAQLFGSESAILDIRPSRLGVDSARDAVWYPRPLYLKWDPEFLQALRDLYAGFFLGDAERYTHGIRDLGLGSSSTPLLRHLGNGNQRSVRFRAADLRSTLRDCSALRSAEDARLHRNFVAFGIYVASLYELLESLDLCFDVRSAFMRVYREG
ncbi:MAG: hypothetical protein E4H00_00510 [Myxococcales bacterium]|nr:MAG: hypothetical protein E4H00_00510 [Myxococcales bacterium]